jgi:peptidoglycan/xylan/chitin deacetylase (PgdA/CDA1 family)
VPLPLFRSPYSATTPEAIADVNGLGYAVIEFTQDTKGYLGPKGGMSAGQAVQRAVDALVPGAILQMHVGSNGDGAVLDALALPWIIDAGQQRGYEVPTAACQAGNHPGPAQPSPASAAGRFRRRFPS